MFESLFHINYHCLQRLQSVSGVAVVAKGNYSVKHVSENRKGWKFLLHLSSYM